MAANLSIRHYRDDDFDAVVALWRDCGLLAPWNDPARDIDLCRRTQTAALFVGETGGAMVASVMVGHDGHRGWLYYLGVAPAHQGAGFGRRLVLHAEDWLVARGLPKVQLMIRDTNTEVRGFYERLGYDPAPRLVMERWLMDVPGKTRRPR